MGSGQLDPLGRRTTPCAGRGRTSARPSPWLAPRARHVGATEVHLGAAAPGSRAGSPASAGGAARRGGSPRLGAIARVDGREPPAVAVQDQAGQRLGSAVARLEIGRGGLPRAPSPPGDELAARPEAEVATLAGLEEEVVEAVEGGLGGLVRRGEAIARSPRRRSGASWRTTRMPLFSAFRIRCRVDFAIAGEDGLLVGPLVERQRDPVPRRLDLLDRAKAGGRDPFAVAVVGGGNLGIGRERRRHPRLRAIRRSRSSRPAIVAPSPTGDGTPGQVAARAADERPWPEQGERPRAIVADEEARPPAGPGAMLGPGARLVDVASRSIDRGRVPVGELRVGRLADSGQSAPPTAAPRFRRFRALVDAGRPRPCLAARSRRSVRPSGSSTRSQAPM